MKKIDYSIVITTYNNHRYFRALLETIHYTCKNHMPKSIIVADDCSTGQEVLYTAKVFNTKSVPIRFINLNHHEGPFYAETAGLDKVENDFAVVLHADTVLHGGSNLEGLYKDVLSVLVSYLSQTDDAVAVSCYSLATENPIHVQRGPRSLGIDGLPYSYYREYRFESLYNIRQMQWHREPSCDSNIYALRMSVYKELSFDEGFAPYIFYHDDFFARAREKGYHVYFTRNTVAYHPRNQNKPDGSLAVVDSDLYIEKSKLFKSIWAGSNMWQAAAIEGETEIREYIGRNY